MQATKDYQNVANERALAQVLRGRRILLSALVYYRVYLVFTKSKLIVLTEDRVIVANGKTKQMRFMNSYQDLMGITRNLRTNSTNFVIHFGQRAEEEWFCPERDEIIQIIDEQCQKLGGKPLAQYGVSSPTLDDFVTTERDLARRISKIPGKEYLLTKRNSLTKSQVGAMTEPQELEEWEDNDELYDDFVILERPNYSKYNQDEALQKEKDSKAAGESMMLKGKPGLQGEEVTLDDFEITKVIDKGSFGKVFLVYNPKMQRYYAMKRINKDLLLQKKQVENIKNEKDILFQADHPFVNSMDFVYQNELRIYFFLKYLPGGNIYDNIFRLKRFQEPTVKFIAAQLVMALGYLHEKGVVHRDLKPENVLMDVDGYISLADFGLAKFLTKQDQTYSFCGTAEYLAPEILNMTGHSFSVDWWTLGILMYEMATGRPPFLNKSHHKLGVLIRTGKIVFPDPVKHNIFMSDALKDIILRLLDRDMKRRLGSQGGVEEIKAHPFFKDVNWDAIYNKEIEAEYKPDLQALEECKQEGFEPQLLMQRGEGGQNQQQLGHSIMQEDENDALTQQQKDYVRQNQDKFKNF